MPSFKMGIASQMHEIALKKAKVIVLGQVPALKVSGHDGLQRKNTQHSTLLYVCVYVCVYIYIYTHTPIIYSTSYMMGIQ